MNDNYETEKEEWELIKEYIPKDKKIWAPFYCTGKQKDIFRELGFDIIHENEDFLDFWKVDVNKKRVPREAE